jgi:triphosphatase
LESEIKLRLNDAEHAKAIQDDDWFEDFAPHIGRVSLMKTHYYDTAERDLSRDQVMFRIREEDDQAVATCKLRFEPGEDGFSQRQEWILVLDEEMEERVEEEGLIAVFLDEADGGGDSDDDLIAVLRPLIGQKLVKLVSASFERTAYDAFFGESLLEIAFDCGELAGGDRTEAFSELEIELKEGDVTDLIEFGRLVREHYDLEPDHQTKFERALALL